MSHAIMEAVYLTALIILFSLVALKESFIVSLSMPISFLGAMALLENIMRYRHELKKDSVTAAVEGTKEISLSVLAGKSTKMIVLVPLLFIGGFVGKVFGPMAQTLLIADAVSYFVALTIIPLLSVAMGREWSWSEPILRRVTATYTSIMDGLRNFYTGILRNALRMRLISLAVAGDTLVAGMGLLRMIGMEVLPKQDSGSFTISLQTEPGSSLVRTSEIVRQVEQLLAREPNVVSWYAQIGFEPGAHSFSDVRAMGVTQALISVKLTTRTERAETIWQVEDRLRSEIARIPGIETFVVKEAGATAMATTAAPIDIRISGSDPQVLYQLARDIKERVSRIPGAVNLYTSWSLTTPEVTLRVKEERAAELGFNPSTVIREVFASLEGIPASALMSSQRKDTAISVRLRPEDRASLDRLAEVTLTLLLIDFIIRAREKGLEREDAIISSVRVRYRPIMMTALSQVFGMLPLAMERAVGSERFSPLATTVIGGILTATLLTMVVVPVVYTIFDDTAVAVRSLFVPRLKGAAQKG